MNNINKWVVGSTKGELVMSLDYGINVYGDGPADTLFFKNGMSKYESEALLNALNQTVSEPDFPKGYDIGAMLRTEGGVEAIIVGWKVLARHGKSASVLIRMEPEGYGYGAITRETAEYWAVVD